MPSLLAQLVGRFRWNACDNDEDAGEGSCQYGGLVIGSALGVWDVARLLPMVEAEVRLGDEESADGEALRVPVLYALAGKAIGARLN